MAKTTRKLLAFVLLSVAAPLTVFAASQTIAFDAIPNQIFGVSPFVIVAQASSCLPVSFASTTPGVCKLSGNLVMLVSVGPCFFTASQAGNGSFSAATPVTQGFTVSQAKASGSFGVRQAARLLLEGPQVLWHQVTSTATAFRILQLPMQAVTM